MPLVFSRQTKSWRFIGIATLFFLLYYFPLSAQTLEGDWKGVLDADGIKLRIGMHILRIEGKLGIKIDMLDQGMNGITASGVSFTDTLLGFDLGGAKYHGKWLPQEGRFEGTFSQPGRDFELDFERGIWIILRPQEPKPPFPYHTEEVRIKHPTVEGVELAGTLTLPVGEGPFPAIVLVSGSGPSSRDEAIMMHKPFLVIADHMSRNGIAVLRYDDRGCFQSKGNFAMATSADLASDAAAAVTYLRNRKDLPIKAFGVAGHSEGGIIAPMVAAADPTLDFIILLAGTGVRGDHLLIEQYTLVSRAMGVTEEEITQGLTTNRKLFDLVLTGKPVKKIRPKMEKCLLEAAEEQDTTVSQASMNATISQIISPWMRYFISHDPATVLRKVHCPVLILNGDKDIQVPASQNVPAIEAALKQAGNTQFQSKVFPGLNHLFQHCQECTIGEYGHIEETFAPQVLETMEQWIANLELGEK